MDQTATQLRANTNKHHTLRYKSKTGEEIIDNKNLDLVGTMVITPVACLVS